MSEHIFLSYSRRDIEPARRLYGALRRKGHSVWFDKESLLPGEDWELAIENAIHEAKAVLICLSSNWVHQRGYIHKELKLALEIMKEIPEGQIHTIPVRLDQCPLPQSLRRLQWVDIFEPDGLDKLERALEPWLISSRSLRGAASTDAIDAYAEFMRDALSKARWQSNEPLQDASGGIHITIAAEVDDELVAAFERLIPQLSLSSVAPDKDRLAEVIRAPSNTVLLARDRDHGGRIVGTLTLVIHRTHTAVRAWIEDVIVDAGARGRGVGQALMLRALQLASTCGAQTVDLTSRPSRHAARKLYEQLGFRLRDTGVYRYVPPSDPD